MPDFAHFVDALFYRLWPALIVAALIAWGVGLLGYVSGSQVGRRRFFASMFVFAGIIGGFFAVSAFIKHAALSEIKPRLSADVERVTVNGSDVNNGPAVIDAIRGMHDVIGHHSSPTIRYRISIETSRGPLTLLLRRDSQDSREYWVYYTGFHSTQSNALGHVFTPIFDGM